MAPIDRDTLAGCRTHLKEVLDGCLTSPNDKDPTKRFARRGITRERLEEQRLTHLFHLLYIAGHDKLDSTSQDRGRSIARKIRGSGGSSAYCNILATLLYARCSDESLRTLGDLLLDGKLPEGLSDNDRTLPKDELCNIFGWDDGLAVWEHQSLFRPVILTGYDENVYEGESSPLPFGEDPVEIGRGTYAIVYKVKIEEGHLIMDKATGSAYNSKYYAQKKFSDFQPETKKSFEAEGSILKKFIQADKHHENILVTKASLQWGGTYSLFFDLAKYNLEDYFRDGDMSMLPTQKAMVFGQCIGLAGALAFLHNDLFLNDSSSEQLQCYHLDLKPQNVLVFERDEPNGRQGNFIWKISDFGISKIKHCKRRGSSESSGHHVSFLEMIFRPKKPSDGSSGVDNSRYGGTYAAPEARLESDKVTRKSDVWSLGCLITLVLTFLDSGKIGIADFGDSRLQGRDNDRFFETNLPVIGTEAVDELHPSVPKWLDGLVAKAHERSEHEGEAVEKTSQYVLESMLLADEEKRHDAKQVEDKLKGIQLRYSKSIETLSKPGEHPQESPSGTPNTWGEKIIDFVIPHHRERERSMGTSQFPIEDGFKKYRCSQGGRYLTSRSDTVISTMLVTDIQEGRPARVHTSPSDRKWVDSSIGSEYLCAAPKSRYFECYYACLSDTSSANEGHIKTEIESPVHRVVVSPNDEITAFLLEVFRDGKRTLRLALYHTQEILEISMQRARHSSESSDSAAEELPLTSIIKPDQGSEIRATAGVVDMRFSNDSKTFTAVTKPYKRGPTEPLQYDIRTWDVVDGSAISVIERKLAGSGDTLTTITPFSGPSFAAVSNTETSFITFSPPQYGTRSHPIGHRILDILANEEKEELILISCSEPGSQIMVYRVPINTLEELDSTRLDNGIETGLISEVNSQTVASWYRTAEGRSCDILIANIPAGEKMGHLLCLRRAALRVLSSSPSSIKSRPITSLTIPISRLNTQRTTVLPLQRRWASEEAATQQEPEADGAREAQHDLDSASSSLENATDSAKEHASAAASQVSNATESATETAETTASSTWDNATDSVKERASAAASQVSDAAQSATETVTGAAQSLGAAAGFGSPRNPENPGGSRGNAPPLDGEPSETVYIGNLYFDVRNEDLKNEFERAGPIEEAKVIMDHRGLSKGFGYIRFQDVASATKAIELYNLQNFEGRRLSVQYSIYRGKPAHGRDGRTPTNNDSYDSRTGFPTARPQNPPTKTLFIGNMSFDMSDRDLNDLFRGVKDVIDVRVAIDRRTGQPRGFAHADFVDVQSAEKAAEYLRGKIVCGRALRIDFSTSSGRAVLPKPGSETA